MFLLTVFLASLQLLTAQAQPVRVVFLGDSLTAGYGVESKESYPMLLKEKWKTQFPKLEVINSSISGSTSAGAVGRLQWLLKNKPDILILALGANDGLRGFQPDTTYKNLSETIELAQKNKIQVILAGMQMPINYGADYRMKFVKVFKDLGAKYKLVLVPFLLEGVAGEKELNIADGIHPNAKGHERIAKLVGPYVEKVIAEKK